MPRLVLASFVIAIASLAVPPAEAATVSGCAGTTPDFCLAASADFYQPGTTTPQTTAAATADVAVQFTDTTPNHTNDTSRWLASLGLTLADGRLSPFVTPSSALPDGLLVAGGTGSCTSPDFTDCGAGHGTVLVNVTGTGFFDGVHPTTFGVDRVTNVVPTDGATVEWDAQITMCVPTPLGACSATQSTTARLAMTTTSAGGGTLAFPTSGAGSYPYLNITVNYTYALDQISLALHGESAQTTSGPAGATYPILRLPRQCGTMGLVAVGTDAGGRSTSLHLTAPVNGCPAVQSARSTAVRAYVVDLAAQALTGARPIARYRWAFGDGTTATTTAPGTRHSYPNASARWVTVVAEDSAGAVSSPFRVHLTGSVLTLKAPRSATAGTRIRLSGVLTRGGVPAAGQPVALSACRPNGTHCRLLATVSTHSDGSYRLRTTFPSRALYVAEYRGATDVIGVRAQRLVR